jgi:putative DNA methylase
MSKRLIETFLPIAEIGIESLRERAPMTPFPAPNRLHVWFARRPLVASRAAILASLLPADADRNMFLHILGIHGDSIKAKERIKQANRKKERLGPDPYGYSRAFTYFPNFEEKKWITEQQKKIGIYHPIVIDPTAGGGSIPFESIRLGIDTTANDLNPVAAFILKLTIGIPLLKGDEVLKQFKRISEKFIKYAENKYEGIFPKEPEGMQVLAYLWTRTVKCPYCDGLIPLSPNWRLSTDGTGVKIQPQTHEPRVCCFEIVPNLSFQSEGTVRDGDAKCPFPDCGRLVDGDEVKSQAQAGQMGEQLYAVAFKKRVLQPTKSGKMKEKWERGFRAPRPEDDNSEFIKKTLEENLPVWEAEDIVPTEEIGEISNYDRGHRLYGIFNWLDFFSQRQKLCHGYSVETFRQILQEEQLTGTLSEETKAAFGFLSIAIDKLLIYSNRASRWDGSTGRIRSNFDRHDFSFVWSCGEMAPLFTGLGYAWVIEQTGKALEELIILNGGERPQSTQGKGKNQTLPFGDEPESHLVPPQKITITCKSGDNLDHIQEGTVDAVVMDPPYYNNVMYAELSDFFYVWLKRTAGYVYPELFRLKLTDKENEAVANPAKFKGKKFKGKNGASALADRDYRERMAAIFKECRRVLRDDGILTLMFTHKATGAWDALTKGLIDAGFVITASWPVNTEAEGSLHIKDKSAAKSTIFLVCRPRTERKEGDEVAYWEDVEPQVAAAVRSRVSEFQEAGIGGVDLYLACFGPALEAFSRAWPMRRGQPRQVPTNRRSRQQKLFDEVEDPYAVSPEDALNAARREVKQWRLEKLTKVGRNEQLDPLTEWFVLAWDAFKSPQFPYDEGLRLARVVGIDLDREVVGRVAEKKTSDLILWDSSMRAAKGALGSASGAQSMIDALHNAAHLARTRTLEVAREAVERSEADRNPIFFSTLQALLEVLPVSRSFTKIDEPKGLVADAASDFEALENLRRLAYTERVPKPEQLKFWEAPEA